MVLLGVARSPTSHTFCMPKEPKGTHKCTYNDNDNQLLKHDYNQTVLIAAIDEEELPSTFAHVCHSAPSVYDGKKGYTWVFSRKEVCWK